MRVFHDHIIIYRSASAYRDVLLIVYYRYRVIGTYSNKGVRTVFSPGGGVETGL